MNQMAVARLRVLQLTRIGADISPRRRSWTRIGCHPRTAKSLWVPPGSSWPCRPHRLPCRLIQAGARARGCERRSCWRLEPSCSQARPARPLWDPSPGPGH